MTDEFEYSDSEMETDEVVTSDEETTTEDSNEGLTDREKQFLARAKKAEGKLKTVKSSFDEPKATTINKTNTEHSGVTIEHSYLFAQGLDLDEVKIVEKVAKLEGKTLTEAYQDDYTQSKINAIRQDKQVKANSLPASNGSAPAPRAKTPGNMTDAEHRAWAENRMKGAMNK